MLITIAAFSNIENPKPEPPEYYHVTIKGDYDKVEPNEGGVDIYCNTNPANDCVTLLFPMNGGTDSMVVIYDGNPTTYSIEDTYTQSSSGSSTVIHVTLK